MSENKTHYRKAFKSPYLSSADVVGIIQLTISHVKLEQDKTKKTKDYFNTAYFKEKFIRNGEVLKPMILNAGNSRILKNMSGSSFIEDWLNMPVEIYVDSNVRFGRDTVEGLRISPEPPKMKPAFDSGSKEQMNRASEAYKRDGNFDAVEKHVILTEDDKNKIKELSK